VPPDQSVAGQLKKKVLTARDNPSQLFGETEYRYGPDRNLLKAEVYHFRDNQRVMGEYTEYSYDNAGRQAGSDNYVRHASGDFRLFAQTVFEYADGLLVRETITYPAQVVTVITYEYAEGRLVKKSFLDGNNALHYYLAFEYDGAGKLTGETNFLPSGTPTQFVRYTYRNGLRQEKNTFSGDPARPERELWSTIRYGYDGQNRLAFEKTEYISPLSSSIFPTVRYEYY
jgi:YD repeat-containing protein